MVGDFSRYATAPVTASNGNISFTNPLNTMPKLVIVEGESVGTNGVQYFVCTPTCGAYKYNASNFGIVAQPVESSASLDNAKYYMSASEVIINKATSTRTFQNIAIYNAYIYA